ncbi:MAG: WYL domain-containing protein, partial [Nostoc sp.]
YLFALVPDWHSWNIQTSPNVEQNSAFRVDRIIRIGAASHTPWIYTKFPKIDLIYRLTGALATYKPRRPHENIIFSPENTDYVDILTQEDYVFWFNQRILQYGASATVLDPPWVVQQVKNAHKKAYDNYSVE